MIAMISPPECRDIVGQPIALDHLAISNCMRRRPDSSASTRCLARSWAISLRMSPTALASLLLATTSGVPRQHDQRRLPSSESGLPRMISLVLTVSMNLS